MRMHRARDNIHFHNPLGIFFEYILQGLKKGPILILVVSLIFDFNQGLGIEYFF